MPTVTPNDAISLCNEFFHVKYSFTNFTIQLPKYLLLILGPLYGRGARAVDGGL